jgi:membrane protease YdiL (CAAX protease family)
MPKFSWKETVSIFLLCISAILLIGLQWKPWAWIVMGFGMLFLLFCPKEFSKNIALIYISLLLLGLTPITTDISFGHMLFMGIMLTLALALPYLISRFIFKEHYVKFKFHHGRNWYRSEILYIIITAFICYFLLPFYLKNTQAYLNWTVTPGASYITRLFLGTNGLGIWDELFFVSTVLGIFRRFMPFSIANIAQAILFTSFLYELGFTGWGFIMIFVFALVQGYVFKKTESLFYVITIHLTLDLLLFLALLQLHQGWIPLFIT